MASVITDLDFQHEPLRDPACTIRQCRFPSTPTISQESPMPDDDDKIIWLELGHYTLPYVEGFGMSRQIEPRGWVYLDDDRETKCAIADESPTESNMEPVAYTAVSYCWGTGHSPKTKVYINQRQFWVSHNLGQLLDMLGQWDAQEERPGERLLWIDQICIDQSNLSEQNTQVAIMGRIYSQAETVYAWLRPALPSTLLAIWLLDLLERPGHGLSRARLDPPVEALIEYFSGQYWTRLWIVQKVILARALVLCCGDHKRKPPSEEARFFLESSMSFWCEKYGLSGPFPDEYLAESGLIAVRALQLLREHSISQAYGVHVESNYACYARLRADLSFQNTLKYRERECQDPRDKVFALQAPVSEDQRIYVDYSATVEKVFFNWLKKANPINHSLRPTSLNKLTKQAMRVYYAMGLTDLDFVGVRKFIQDVAGCEARVLSD